MNIKHNDYAADFNEYVMSLIKERKEAILLQGECDREISDFHHLIELQKHNAAQLAKIMKSFRQVLEERRETKDKIYNISRVLSKIKGNDLYVPLSTDTKREYAFRTNVVEEIFMENKED